MTSAGQSAGTAAALGPRQRLRSRLRRWGLRQIQRVDWHLARPDRAEYLEFVPPVKDAAELAQLSARVTWYLPARARRVPIYVRGAREHHAPRPEDASFMDPSLVVDPGWADSRPSGRGHRVVHRLTPGTVLGTALKPHRTTVVAPAFAYGTEEAFFPLHRAVSDSAVPDAQVSLERILAKRKGRDVAFALGTGPSAQLVDPARDIPQDAIRIGCNSIVRDSDWLKAFAPDVIAFGDPVFHHGPSRYASAFRTDLLRALDDTDALLVTTHLYVEPFLAHLPEVADRLAVLHLEEGDGWWWPTAERPTSRSTGNVLTNLMLPLAFALAERVLVAGCDGRAPTENYFWKHNARIQYSDEVMQTAFDAHPAFFRDRDYVDYYDHHCEQLEEFLCEGERHGKQIVGVTPSHIPALRSRGAPTP